jgi:hypothetical protein
LGERLGSLPSAISATPIFNQMEKLGGIKKEAERKLRNLESGGTATGMPAELKSYESFRAGLREILENDPSPEIKATITRFAIRWIKVHESGFDINWAIGEGYVKSVLESWEAGNTAASKREKAQKLVANLDSSVEKEGVESSNTLTFGSGSRTRTKDPQAFFFVTFPAKLP